MSNDKMVSAIIIALIVAAVAPMIPSASATDSNAIMYHLDLNHTTSFWGIPMDCEWNTSGWHIRAAIAHLCDKEWLVDMVGIPSAIVIDNPVPKISNLYPAWYLMWTPNLLSKADPLHGSTAISLYNNVQMAPDIYEARDHFIAAGGIGNDGLPWHDYDDDGRIDNPPTSQVEFIALNPAEAPLMWEMATMIHQLIEYVFNDADVVSLVACTWLEIVYRLFYNTGPDDWQIHFGVNVGSLILPTTPPPCFLEDLYHSTGVLNYVFYSNPEYDDCFVTPPPFNPARAMQAQRVFGETIGTIPIYCIAI